MYTSTGAILCNQATFKGMQPIHLLPISNHTQDLWFFLNGQASSAKWLLQHTKRLHGSHDNGKILLEGSR